MTIPKTQPHVVQIVPGGGLRRAEATARAVVRRFFPSAGALRLYRTTDGRILCLLDLTTKPGDGKRLANAFEAVSRVLGEW